MFWECKRTFANEVWLHGWTDTAFSEQLAEFRATSGGAWQFIATGSHAEYVSR
jgi:hypothetical protein